MRRLPVLQLTAWAKKVTSEAPFELFRDWQRTQTQSSATALRSLRQQMDVRSCVDAGTTSREAQVRDRKSWLDQLRALLSSPGDLVLFS